MLSSFPGIKSWLCKLAWMSISFKVLSFVSITGLMLLAWRSANEIFLSSVELAKQLHDKEYINSEQVTQIVTHTQTVMFDSLLGHVSTFGMSVLVAIVAIKGMSSWNEAAKEREVIKKVSAKSLENGGLKKFLPKTHENE